jgi:2-phosphosulfolactate phosphatase
VGGKTVVFTTTNGTQALLRCRGAARVLTAAFVNVSAVAEAVDAAERVDLLCAGTRGIITREDVLLAGCLTERLIEAVRLTQGRPPEMNDSAQIALDAWQATCGPTLRQKSSEIWEGTLRAALSESQGGRDLIPLGLAEDIADAAMVDRWPCVPELDITRWTIHDGRRR